MEQRVDRESDEHLLVGKEKERGGEGSPRSASDTCSNRSNVTVEKTNMSEKETKSEEEKQMQQSLQQIMEQVKAELEARGKEGEKQIATETGAVVAGAGAGAGSQPSTSKKDKNNLLVLDRVRKQLGLPGLVYSLKEQGAEAKKSAKTEAEAENEAGPSTSERRWKPWSKEEDAAIASGYIEGRSIKQMLELLPYRTYYAVEKRKQKLIFQGILDPSLGQESWTEEENRVMEKCMKQNLDVQQILESNLLPGRTYHSILAKIDRLKEKNSHKKAGQWTEEEDGVIATGVRNDTPIQDLMTYLPGRSYGTVKQRRHLLLSKGSLGQESSIKERKFWTEEEDQVIFKLIHEKMPVNYFQEHLPGRSRAAINMRRKMLKGIIREGRKKGEQGGDDTSNTSNGKHKKRPADGELTSEKDKVGKVVTFSGQRSKAGKGEAKLSNWKPEEDKVIIQFGGQRNSLQKIMGMLPGRTKAAIESRRYLLKARNLFKVDDVTTSCREAAVNAQTKQTLRNNPQLTTALGLTPDETQNVHEVFATKSKEVVIEEEEEEEPEPEPEAAGPSTSGYNDVWSEINDMLQRAKNNQQQQQLDLEREHIAISNESRETSDTGVDTASE